MIAVGIALIPVGLVSAGWGVWASFQPSKRRAWIGVAVAPLGILGATVGTILVCLPNFFS